MKTITLTLLVACLCALPAIHLAAADETKADCENNVNYTDANGNPASGPQPWAGYAQTDSVKDLVGGTVGYDTVRNCEGEQWDGQDSVQGGQDPTNGGGNNAAGCNKADVVRTANGAFVGSCAAPDPNQGAADPLGGSGMPVVFRVSYLNAGGHTQEFYVATDIADVGRASTYVGVCTGTDAGLEGAAECPANSVTGTHDGEARYGVYLRDNTPGNVLAQVVSSLGITKGHVAESDCDQSTYQSGAYAGDRSRCGRDNTAVTVDSVLP